MSSDLQKRVKEAVDARGYIAGWNSTQLVARQICKAVEEVGELADAIKVSGFPEQARPLFITEASEAGAMARWAFDQPLASGMWDVFRMPEDLNAFIKESCDVLIPLLVLAETIGFDLLEETAKAALGDVDRGVRNA